MKRQQEATERLFSAIRRNDLVRVQIALEQGANIQQPEAGHDLQMGPLALAIWLGRSGLVDPLINHGADPQAAHRQIKAIAEDATLPGQHRAHATRLLGLLTLPSNRSIELERLATAIRTGDTAAFEISLHATADADLENAEASPSLGLAPLALALYHDRSRFAATIAQRGGNIATAKAQLAALTKNARTQRTAFEALDRAVDLFQRGPRPARPSQQAPTAAPPGKYNS